MKARQIGSSKMPTTNRVAVLRFELQMAEIRERIGGRIRELREERKREDPRWTQDYLARQIDPLLTGSQISRYERGEIRPEDDRLEKIAEILGTDVPDLFKGPIADRQEKKATPDVLGKLNGAVNQLDRLEALEQRVAALEAEQVSSAAEADADQRHSQTEPGAGEANRRRGGG